MTRNYKCEVRDQVYSEKYVRSHCANGEICSEDPNQGRCSVIRDANKSRAQSQPSGTEEAAIQRGRKILASLDSQNLLRSVSRLESPGRYHPTRDFD